MTNCSDPTLTALRDHLAGLPEGPEGETLPETRAWCALLRRIAHDVTDVAQAEDDRPLSEFLERLLQPPAGRPFLSRAACMAALPQADAALPTPAERSDLSDLTSPASPRGPSSEKTTGLILADEEVRLRLALARSPHDLIAHQGLADIYQHRALAENNSSTGSDWRTLCALHDTGKHECWIQQLTSVHIDSLPSGASVVAHGPNGRIIRGQTPMQVDNMPVGCWTLDIESGKKQARVLRFFTQEDNLDDPPVVLIEAPDPKWVYVPGGPFIYGGDPSGDYPLPRQTVYLPGFLISCFPITISEYVSFLNGVSVSDPEGARMRVPRRLTAEGEPRALLATQRDAETPFRVPPHRDPNQPVVGVSYEDALAYAAWASQEDGAIYRLPTEREWEKSARGVDGRFWPWGDSFDPTKCNMRHSRARPELLPVGMVEGDVSPFGMRDAAGNILELCTPARDLVPAGGIPVRGGSWHSSPQACRVADRFGVGRRFVDASLGFRLVQSVSPRANFPSHLSPVVFAESQFPTQAGK